MGEWARAVQSVVLVVVGVTLILTATTTGRPISSGAGLIVLGSALVLAAGCLSARSLCRLGGTRRAVRRGIRQIETVLELESALKARRLTVGGTNGGCPNCGAPAGPHCVCRRR